MARALYRAMLAGGALSVAPLGCGDEPADGEHEVGMREAKAAWCAAACPAATLCGLSTGGACEERCELNPDGLFARMTAGAVVAQADCLTRATSCSEGLDALFSACARESWSGFEATDAARATCEAMAAPFFECHWFNSFEECASVHAVFQAPALEAWQTCVNSGCDELESCMVDTLYTYGD